MTISVADIPVVTDSEAIALSRGSDRRTFLKRAGQSALAAGVGYLALTSRAAPGSGITPSSSSSYWKEWTGITSGPCGPSGYARNHTEHSQRCGPSWTCDTTGTWVCCKYYGPPSGGSTWHRNGRHGASSAYFYWRANQCRRGGYDSWRWKFSNNVVYGCADGWTCIGGQNGNCWGSICPGYRYRT